ncbi:Glycoside-Pentoside-Hexuronide (GPH):Cation Symporter Family [Thraustotheca clavata]|uniref:Glycoside-Pentoside-Hexuronide (GPH):Cation Symporter Family n=1 Tax=Thraustotheca clavata TaxID=74557 RepID=A0A1V9ZV96_9STRA|nr:Glycoside-Pentoside-Hexuronide (GPH):Cation Symporter Family [Thraustotheca clavata]
MKETDYNVVTTPVDDMVKPVDEEIAEQVYVEGCSIPFMFLLCAPKMAMNMAWAAQWAALGPLLEILLKSHWVQLVQLVGPTTGLLVAPTIGVLSDNCSSKWGRRRPYLFWGAIASALCWLIMMHTVDIGEALGDTKSADITKNIIEKKEHLTSRKWTTFFTVLCYIWMDITCNVTQVPAGLIIADFAGDRQVTAASIGGAYSIAGSFAVSGYILFFGAAHESIKSFMTMLIVIMLVTTMSVSFFVKETLYVPTVQRSKSKEIKEAFSAVWTGIRMLPYTLAVYAVIFVLIQYGWTAYTGAKGQFFGIVVKGGESDGADKCGRDNLPDCTDKQTRFNDGVRIASGSTDTILNCVSLVFLSILPFLVRKFGAKRVLTISIIPQTLLILMAFSKIIALDMAIIVCCCATQSALSSLVMPTIIHVVGHGTDNNLGLFSGAFNSANCLGQFLNFGFSSILVQSSMGYALPVLVGGILSAVAFFIALFKLDFKMHSL